MYFVISGPLYAWSRLIRHNIIYFIQSHALPYSTTSIVGIRKFQKGLMLVIQHYGVVQ